MNSSSDAVVLKQSGKLRAHGTRIGEWILAASLSSFAYLYALTSGSLSSLLVALALGLLAPLFVASMTPGHQRLSPRNGVAFTILAAYLLANLCVNCTEYTNDPAFADAFVHTAGFIAYLFVLAWMASNVDVPRLLRRLGILLIPLAYIAIRNDVATSYGRATPFGLQPNWWGELMVALSICTLGSRRILLRAAVYLLSGMLLYFVQSRSGMVGWSIVICVDIGSIWKRLSPQRRVFAALTAVTAAYLGMAFTGLPVFLGDQVLRLHDPFRGLGTGLVGRVQGWRDAFDAFSSSPIWGAGIGTYRYVHNGFLQVVAEEGTLLGLIFVTLLFRAVLHAWRDRNAVRLGALLSVAAYMAFQPRALNLNLTSLIFWLAIYDWGDPRDRRTATSDPRKLTQHRSMLTGPVARTRSPQVALPISNHPLHT